MEKHKILIADDHSMIRDGIKTLLKQNKSYEVAGEAVNGREAVEKYKALRPDLIIMDISMPELNGMEAAKEILTEDPTARIVMLSMYDDEDYISLCMEYGVKGYVVKNETGSELDYAVKTVLKGQNYFSNQVQQVIFKKYSNNVTRKKQKEPEVNLTTREVEILKLISEGLTSLQMADKLFISPRTVETHRANLMKKTGAKNSIELVKKAQATGLL
ncbi:response regulator [Chryseolinea lacunae]|uniref:Response regulator transcription factor n=1 Tax=Chryseolinea lacunae TaxID=2801331 RepID=A0ABS1KNU8_9BACT|nr:response regulator transcription factor [Chryseolinea lacunae]MBL0741106.1 response regulator transcription factor [Chryseolinea lacunae]